MVRSKAEGNPGERNDELPIVPVDLFHGQSLQVAVELFSVDATEQDGASVGIQVVQPEAVCVCFDPARVEHRFRQICVGRPAKPGDDGLIGRISDAQYAHYEGAVSCSPRQ